MRTARTTSICTLIANTSLRRAVQRALQVGTGIVAAGVTVGIAPTAVAGAFPPVFELASLLRSQGGDGSLGVAFDGAQRYDFVGASLSDLGDVNGDGLDDFIVGAPGGSTPNAPDAGQSFVIYGRDTGDLGDPPPELILRRLAAGDGSIGFAINGVRELDYTGYSVSAAGDVNGDGVPDIIVGPRPRWDTGDGRVYVIFGHASTDTPFPAVFPLAQLLPGQGGDGSAGFVLNGLESGRFGFALSGAGDVNGDGVDDLVMSSPGGSRGPNTDGLVYIVFGRDTTAGQHFPAIYQLASLLPGNGGDGSEGFIVTADPTGQLGTSVAGGGDVNGDGVDDLLIARPLNTFPNPGRFAFVMFGRDTTKGGRFPPAFDLSDVDGRNGFAIGGNEGYERASQMSIAGDVNGDGIDDILIGDPLADIAGRGYVLFGRPAKEGFPAVFNLGNLASGDGSKGFVLNGIEKFDSVGTSVSNAGDVNGDGIDDMILGAVQDDFYCYYSPCGHGEAFVIFGRDTPQSGKFPPVVELSDLLPVNGGDGSVGFVMDGVDAGAFTGASVSGAGDVNGDGIDDMLVGAPFSSGEPFGEDKIGQAYLVFGRAAKP